MTSVYISPDLEINTPAWIAERDALRQIERTGDLARKAQPFLREIFDCVDYVDRSWRTEAPPAVRPWVIGYCADRGVKVSYTFGQNGNSIVTVRREDGAR